MGRARVVAYRGRIRAEFERAFAEEHTPHEVAGSFAVGVFVTSLPTLGTGLLLFAALAYLSDRVNRVALFSAVLVFNPVVKWGVYAASVWLGVRLLGPVPGVSLADVTPAAGRPILLRLLAGNLVLSVVFTVVGYAVAFRLVTAFRRRDLDVETFLPGASD